MDLDEEILQRLTNTEDHLTEHKSKPHRDQCSEAIVAFANSALPNKPGILYVGVSDKGEILQDKAPESWQHDITAWGNGCFPELPVITRTLTKDGKEFLAVVVQLSEVQPHFARPAFKRQGAKTIPASQQEIDEWIAYRNSKVRVILEWKGRDITVTNIQPPDPPIGDMRQRLISGMVGRGVRNVYSVSDGGYRLLDCNAYWVTVKNLNTSSTETIPLSIMDLKMDDQKHQLALLLVHYF